MSCISEMVCHVTLASVRKLTTKYIGTIECTGYPAVSLDVFVKASSLAIVNMATVILCRT